MTKQTIDPLKEARRLARAAGLFVVEKGADFCLYRKTPARAVYLGKRSNPAGLFSLVKRCAAAQ